MLRFAPPLLLLHKLNLTVPSSDSAVKVRSHSMYTDTNFNSANTVYSNIYQAMLVVALKFRAYVQEWSGSLRGKVTFFWSTSVFLSLACDDADSIGRIDALQKIVKYEHSALVRQSRGRKAAKLAATFDLERSHVLWCVLPLLYSI